MAKSNDELKGRLQAFERVESEALRVGEDPYELREFLRQRIAELKWQLTGKEE